MPKQTPGGGKVAYEVPATFASRVAMGLTRAALGREFDADARVVARWMADPEVQAEVASIQAEVRAATRNRLISLADTAIDVVEELCTDEEQPAPARLAAAKTILDRVAPVASEVHLSGSVGVTLSDVSDAELDTAEAEAMAEALRAAGYTVARAVGEKLPQGDESQEAEP